MGGTDVKLINTHDKFPNEAFCSDQADSMLNDILEELQMEPARPQTEKWHFRRIALFRYLTKRAALLVCVSLAFFFFAPGTVMPASVSHVSAAPASDSSSVQVRFQVDTLIPVQEVTAQINEHSLTVETEGRQEYWVDVGENGYLLLDIYSVTGMHSSHGIEIAGIDEEAPVVVSHQTDGDLILIYLSDGDGVGVDFDAITACCTGTDEALAPAWYDESSGCVAFPCMDQAIEITIPDRNGNYRVLLLAPSWN